MTLILPYAKILRQDIEQRRKSNMKTAKFIQFALLLRYTASAEALVLFGLQVVAKHLAWLTEEMFFFISTT